MLNWIHTKGQFIKQHIILHHILCHTTHTHTFGNGTVIQQLFQPFWVGTKVGIKQLKQLQENVDIIYLMTIFQ